MTPKAIFSGRSFCASLLALLSFVSAARAQQQQDQTNDVIRISTELVQTGVTVFDKQGKFVEGLKPEQFEIRVDGKPVKVSFFEQVAAGTAAEEKQVAAAAGADSNKTKAPTSAT